MENRQHIQPDSALIARLHAACRPQGDAISMKAASSGDYLVEKAKSPLGCPTLGASLERKPQNA